MMIAIKTIAALTQITVSNKAGIGSKMQENGNRNV